MSRVGAFPIRLSHGDALETRPPGLSPSLGILLVVWTVLVVVPWLLATLCSTAAARLLSFGVVTALLVATRGPAPERVGHAVALAAIGAAAGFASFPAWLEIIGGLGLALGLGHGTTAAPASGTALSWAATVFLAPVFEEMLYRERLLGGFSRVIGVIPAVVVTSALFALPHLSPWPMLGTFSVGLGLGAVMWLGGSVWLCIGVHAGLNLAAIVCGVPAARAALPAAQGALVAIALVGGAAWASRPARVGRSLRMRRMAALAAAALCLVAPRGLRAAELGWEGTLTLSFGAPGLGSLSIPGTGVATVNGSSGGPHLESLTLAGGISGSDAVPVTDPQVPLTLNELRLTVTLGTGALQPFTPPVPGGQPQLTAAALPVAGVLKFCLLILGCGASLDLPLSQAANKAGGGALGVGGLVTANGFGMGGSKISMLAAPWTIGTAAVSVRTTNFSMVTVTAQGWLHGAGSFTSSTAITGGALSLVTPVHIDLGGDELAAFGRLTVRFVPEPGFPLLLGAGVGGCVLLSRRPRP